MQLTLEISLFGSALGDSDLPEFSHENPYQAGLVLEDFEEPVGVELIEVLEVNARTRRVVSRTINSELSSIAEGSGFFLTRSGKMLGKGRIEQTGI